MTYTSALEWANNNIPKDDYDTFEDWYDKMTEKFTTPELTNSDVFKDLAKDEWVSEIGALDKSELEQPIEQEEMPESSRIEEITIGIRIPKQAIENTNKPRIIILPPTGKAPTILEPMPIQDVIEKAKRLKRVRAGIRTKIIGASESEILDIKTQLGTNILLGKQEDESKRQLARLGLLAGYQPSLFSRIKSFFRRKR